MILATILMFCTLIVSRRYKVLPCAIITLAVMGIGVLLFCIVPAWCIVSIGCYLCGVATSLKMVLAIAGLIDVFYEYGAVKNHDKITSLE